MPLQRFLCCFALVAAASSLLVPVVDAAECTSAQVAELSTLSGNVTAVCGSDTLSSTSRTYCGDSACLAYLTSMVANVPSCEVESYNLRSVLTSAISSCNAASDAVPVTKSGAPQPTLPLLLLFVLQLVIVLVNEKETMAELYAEVADEEQRLARGPSQRQYWDRKTFSSFAEQQRAMARSSTLYIGNLSFFTSEAQIYELFSRVGHVKRVIMGLDRFKKTPCGFCFVEYSTHAEAEACAQFLSETKLDNRVVRCEMDGGFREGRQFGRGLSGGQVRDDRRSKDDYDAGRGGYGRGDDATADGHHFRRSAHVKRPRDDSMATDEPPSSRQRRPESPRGEEDKKQEEEENPRFRNREDDADKGEEETTEENQQPAATTTEEQPVQQNEE